MAKRIDRHWRRVPPGTFSGEITFASTDEVEAHADLAAEFILRIFDFEPSDYAISDESDILDFMSIFDRDTSKVWRHIEREYGVTQEEVGSGRLVKIFRAITGKSGRQ